MRILLFILILLPVIIFGQSEILTKSEIKKSFPNSMCAFFDKDRIVLFDGGDFDDSHSDAKNVFSYGCLNFSGDLLASSCYAQSFKVNEFGIVNSEPYHEMKKSKDGNIIVEIYYNNDESITIYTYYDDDEYIQSGKSSNEIGDIHTIINYKNGKMHGLFQKYHEKELVFEYFYFKGEVLMTKEEAVQKLKKMKELLDLRLISEEEYNDVKDELVPFITN